MRAKKRSNQPKSEKKKHLSGKDESARLYLEKIEEKLDYYKQVVKSSNEAIIIQDFKGIVKAWNRAAKHIYGFSEKEMLGKSILKIISKRERSKARKNIMAIKSGKPSFRVRQIRRTKSGKEIFVNITYSPIYEKEEIIEIGTTEEDISELKKAIEDLKKTNASIETRVEKRTAELKENEEKYRQLFNNIADAIFIADPKTRKMVDCNKSAEKLIGFSRDKILSMKADQLHPPDMREQTMKGFKRQAKGKIKMVFSEVLASNKKRIPVAINAKTVRILGKGYLQGIFRDITLQKESEEKLKESYEKLKELDLMKTEFLSMTSHELKTPLTPMRAQIQRMISRELSKEEQKKGLEMVLRNEVRLERLINEVLEISRIESKRLVLSKQLVSPREIIKETITTMDALAKDKKIKIELNLTDLTQKMLIDKYRIGEVLINILDNAIKHSGCTEIKIKAYKKGNQAFICIKDNGKGILKEDIPHLFEHFYQAKKLRGTGAGAGLGLSICKAIVEAHEGKMWVNQKEGKGVEFCLSFPFKTKKIKRPVSLAGEVEI